MLDCLATFFVPVAAQKRLIVVDVAQTPIVMKLLNPMKE